MTIDINGRPRRGPSPELESLLAVPAVPPREPGAIGQGRDTGAFMAAQRIARAAGKGRPLSPSEQRRRKLLFFGAPALAFLALVGAPTASHADEPAVEQELSSAAFPFFIDRLRDAYGEVTAFAGSNLTTGHAVALATRPDGASWTFYQVDLDTGMACPVALGERARFMGPADPAWRAAMGLEP